MFWEATLWFADYFSTFYMDKTQFAMYESNN